MSEVRWETMQVQPQGGGRWLTPGVVIVGCLSIIGLAVPLLLPEDTAISLVQALGLSADGLFHGWLLWQPFTYVFLYPIPCMAWTLVSVLLILLFCGSRLERAWGTKHFLVFWALTTAASGMVRLLPEMESGAVLVGGLGFLCALLAAFGHAFRGEKLWLVLAPAPIGVPYFVIGALVIILLLNLKPLANVLWLSGAAFGLLYAEIRSQTWRRWLGRRRPRQPTDRFSEIDLDR